MDYETLIGKPLRLHLRTGRILIGSIQQPQDNSLLKTTLPFMTQEKNEKFMEKFGEFRQVAVPAKEAQEFIDMIDVAIIKECEVIETELHGIDLTTLNNKSISIDSLELQLKVAGPGQLQIAYRLPFDNDMIELGTFPISNAVLKATMTMVFVSYAKEDEDAVTKVVKELGRYCIVPWFDKFLLLPGDEWERRIEEAIEKCDYFLLFLSAGTIRRNGYKNREFRLAENEASRRSPGTRFIVPILLDDCEPPRELNSFHWLRTSDDDWMKRLLRSIAPPHAQGRVPR